MFERKALEMISTPGPDERRRRPEIITRGGNEMVTIRKNAQRRVEKRGLQPKKVSHRWWAAEPAGEPNTIAERSGSGKLRFLLRRRGVLVKGTTTQRSDNN